MSTRRFLAWIQFEGSDFSGFVRQRDIRTVAGELEAAWKRWRDETIHVRSSSRTDSGVHAERMPVFIETKLNVTPKSVVHGWNHELPDDVAVMSAERVGDEFHVRHDATGKRYVYRIWNARTRSPLRRVNQWFVSRPIDVSRMQRAARDFVGSHDYAAFRSANCQSLSTRRSIRSVTVHGDGPEIEVVVEGNAFLMNMVRIMVGTLVEVGWGRKEVDAIPTILASRDRREAGQTAPARGLTLDEVFYGEHGAREGLNFKVLDGQKPASA